VRFRAPLLIGLVITILIPVGGGIWGWLVLNTPQKITPTTLVIPPGASLHRTIHLLARQGVIHHPLLLQLYAQATKRKVESGWYRFHGTITPLQALSRLNSGQVMQFSLTIAEGLRSDEIQTQLARQSHTPLAQWQQAWQQLAITEGTLLPNSWRYTQPVDPLKLLRRMQQAQRALLAKLDPDPHHWLRLRTIASIIEKETAIASERPIISAVIANRLRRHMALQMDPTVIYGIIQRDGRFNGNITRHDLHTDSPWNSYRHKGLPPTPICHPGAASLRAAAHPAQSSALYFVANGHGGHRFANTLAEHQRNVRRWLQRNHHLSKTNKEQP